MIRRPPRSTRTDTLFPYTTLFRSAIAAGLDLRKGRNWRPLEDTTYDPIIAARRPKPWTSWQRSEDYYNEGLLIWLEVDGMLRELSRGRKSMDDFAKAFFGGRDGDWGVSPYNFDDVVAALNSVAPHDWATFLRRRVNETSGEAPKGGFAKGGYKLVYTSQPNSTVSSAEDSSEERSVGKKGVSRCRYGGSQYP